MGYPDGNKLAIESTKFYTFQTNDPYSKVVDFYRTHFVLNQSHKNSKKELSLNEYSIRDRGILFVCFHILGGFFGDEVEIGCVHVRDENGLRIVDVAWSYGATTTAGCDYMIPSIKLEDIAP